MSRQHLFCTLERKIHRYIYFTGWHFFFIWLGWPSYFTNSGVHREVLGLLLYFLIIETFFPRDILKYEKGQLPCYEIYSFKPNKHKARRPQIWAWRRNITESFIRRYLLSITTCDPLLILSVQNRYAEAPTSFFPPWIQFLYFFVLLSVCASPACVTLSQERCSRIWAKGGKKQTTVGPIQWTINRGADPRVWDQVWF